VRTITPKQACDLINKREGYFARRLNPESDPWLDCDQSANVLGELLARHRIAFTIGEGFSDEGGSHVWLIVDGQNLDPTKQGCNAWIEDNGTRHPYEAFE
jgi:hypothetical protein